MRKLILLALLVLVPTTLFAQPPVVTAANKFLIDQGAPDLVTANGYTYKLYVDGATTGAVIAMVCTGTASPFQCTSPVTAFTPGSHTVLFTASNVAGESAKGGLITFVMVIVPAAPTNGRIQ